MRNRRWSIWLMIALATGVLITPGLATAGPILSSVGVTWSNALPTAGSDVTPQFTVGGITQIRWGTPYFGGEPQPGADFTKRSGLGFDPFFPPASAPSGTFTLGNLWHFNQQIWFEGYKLTSADLTLTTTFDGVGSHDFTYRAHVDETYNRLDPCPYGGINGLACDDKITLEALDTAPWTFNWDNKSWTVTPDCPSDFVSREFSATSAPCTASLPNGNGNSHTVPNPSTLLLIGLGLVGLISMTRLRAFRK